MKKISIEELLIWFKHYERYMEGDPIDAVEWRGEFLEFVMYLINNLEDEKEESEDIAGDKIGRDVLDKRPTDKVGRLEDWKEEWGELSFEIGSLTKQQADEVESFIEKLVSQARKEEIKRLIEKAERSGEDTSPRTAYLMCDKKSYDYAWKDFIDNLKRELVS